MNYLRVCTGSDGQTHFEDVEVPTVQRGEPRGLAFTPFHVAQPISRFFIGDLASLP